MMPCNHSPFFIKCVLFFFFYYKSSLLEKEYKSHNVIEMQRKCQKMCEFVVFFYIIHFLSFMICIFYVIYIHKKM
ncbi:hypothetical protein CN433_01195 [Bacillus cereus]|uniref:Uncharacterized protein n=1 Tax=Bacillus cereus TaxID=1396 RepID=A0A9X7BC53_BACCE|nr:hypothetical protein CON26_10800 [Bacillus cereus]PEF20314.1 hypothetical protein CON87_00960 [Bacillus cereus]PET09222.1 hypothetical protein CN516_14500 [Bacillus cereus]PEV96285.1 hypothetical protein CN433_01195 [Bacillus cereus]PFC94308.1 hypothetical protein CN308_14600 [Bacillus cereus]